MWIVFVTYTVLSYLISLRGNEGFLLDIDGLNENWKRNDNSYFIITLLGKIKGENIDRRHLLQCVNHTDSGINLKAMVRRSKDARKDTGFTYGPTILDINGHIYSSAEMDTLMKKPS